MNMFHFNVEMTEAWLQHASTQLPLDAFVALGTLLEEIISPIPVYMITGVAGALAHTQGKSALYVFYLALVAAFMKTIGFYLFYVIGDKLEDVFRNSIAKYFGISHESLEGVGARFTGNHWRDGGFVLISRVIPIFPSTPVSLACGVFRINLKVYLIASFFGILAKVALYLYTAYYGLTVVSQYWASIHESVQQLEPLLLALVILGVAVAFYRYRKKIL